MVVLYTAVPEPTNFYTSVYNKQIDPKTAPVGFLQDRKMTSKLSIKGWVSKNKRRFQEDGYDLDLTYVMDNIIAMGFPADRLEGVYRNHIDDVARFFEEKHPGHYKIYNLCSNREYNYAKFHGRVAHYPFEDHHPPDLKLMRPFCEDVHAWLKKNPKNVVAVHCKAGKGRTGVMICAYLLYVGSFPIPSAALEYYGEQRTFDTNGVTIPSQKRYVEYFGYLLNTNSSHRKVPMLLKSIRFNSIPNFDRVGSQCNPWFAVYSSGKRIYKSQVFEPGKHSPGGSQDLVMDVTERVEVVDDVRIDFYHRPVNWLNKREKMFHFWFNTFFICNCKNKGGNLSPTRSNPLPSCTSTQKSQPCQCQSVSANGHASTGSGLSSSFDHSSARCSFSSDGQDESLKSHQLESDTSSTRKESIDDDACSSNSGGISISGEPPSKKINQNRSMSGPTKATFGLGEETNQVSLSGRSKHSPVHVLMLRKFELDRACKDKSHKLFSQNFKVHVHFECLPIDETTQSAEPCASIHKPRGNVKQNGKSSALRQSASADQPLFTQAADMTGVCSAASVDDRSGVTCHLLPLPGSAPGHAGASRNKSHDRHPSGKLNSTFAIMEEGHSSIHWSSDSEESEENDEESGVICESTRQLRLASDEAHWSTSNTPLTGSSTTSGGGTSSSLTSSGGAVQIRTAGGKKGANGQISSAGSSAPSGPPKARFYFPGKRRGSMPNPS